MSWQSDAPNRSRALSKKKSETSVNDIGPCPPARPAQRRCGAARARADLEHAYRPTGWDRFAERSHRRGRKTVHVAHGGRPFVEVFSEIARAPRKQRLERALSP